MKVETFHFISAIRDKNDVETFPLWWQSERQIVWIVYVNSPKQFALWAVLSFFVLILYNFLSFVLRPSTESEQINSNENYATPVHFDQRIQTRRWYSTQRINEKLCHVVCIRRIPIMFVSWGEPGKSSRIRLTAHIYAFFLSQTK